MPTYIENIKAYFKTLTTEAAVRAVEPRQFPEVINDRDGKLVGICNAEKLRRLEELRAGNVLQIIVTPATATIPVAGTVQMMARAVYSTGDNIDITSQATWRTSNNAAATVNGSGLVTGVASGTTNITAEFQGTTSNAGVITVGP